MPKIPFDETVDLFVDAGAGRFRRRVLHLDERELVYVWTPYLIISALYQYIVDSCDVPSSPRCEFAERFFNNVALCQFIAYAIQSQALQLEDHNEGLSDDGCS